MFNCNLFITQVFKFQKKKIIVPVNICYDVIISIFASGNIPLIIDTNDNLGFSLNDLKKRLNSDKDIRVLIFPYLYGNSDNFYDVFKLCKKNLIFIEDIAGSFGGKIKKKYFGSFGDFTVGSFGKGKIIDMTGGGFISTNNKEVFLKICRNYKLLTKYRIKNKLIYVQSNKFHEKILKIKKKILI